MGLVSLTGAIELSPEDWPIMGVMADRLPIGGFARLVPELDVFDLAHSKTFWCDILGFQIGYQRPENLFMYIELQGAQFMLN
jgi:hypothetical protein